MDLDLLEFLPLELLYAIVLRYLSYPEISILCRSSYSLNQRLCRSEDPYFWQRLYRRDIGSDLPADEEIRDHYLAVMSHFSKIRDLNAGLLEASQKGYDRLVEHFLNQADLQSPLSENVLRSAINALALQGHPQMVDRLIDFYMTSPYLKLVYGISPDRRLYHASVDALRGFAQGNYPHLFDLYLEKLGSTYPTQETLDFSMTVLSAVLSGSISMLETVLAWDRKLIPGTSTQVRIHNRSPSDTWNLILEFSAHQGDLPLVQYAMERQAGDVSGAFAVALAGGHLEVAEYLFPQVSDFDETFIEMGSSDPSIDPIVLITYLESKDVPIDWNRVLMGAANARNRVMIDQALAHGANQIDEAIDVSMHDDDVATADYLESKRPH